MVVDIGDSSLEIVKVLLQSSLSFYGMSMKTDNLDGELRQPTNYAPWLIYIVILVDIGNAGSHNDDDFSACNCRIFILFCQCGISPTQYAVSGSH